MKGKKLYNEIKQLIEQAKSFVVQNINTTLVFTNFNIGRIIVENEQQGSERAKYSEQTLLNLSKKLMKEFGRGYTKRNLELMRKFYVTYSKTKSLISKSGKTKSPISKSKITQSLIRQSVVAKSKQMTTAQLAIAQFGELFKVSWTHYTLHIPDAYRK